MKTKMKLNRSSLFLGIWLALTVLAAVPGYARSSTGINSFHVMWPGSAYSCLQEDYAAVVNHCTYTVSLTFDMPIDNVGSHGIDVVDYPNGAGSFGCQAVTYSPYGHVDFQTPEQTFNATGQERKHFDTFVWPGDSITIICWDVPPSRGITSLNWTP